MSDFCLTINVRSQNRALLDNLVVTLETLNEDVSEIDGFEMFTAASPKNTNTEPAKETTLENINKAVFLECWMINEETMESM